MPQNYSNMLTGFRVQSQIPLNAKQNITSEAVLKDLGTSDNLAFTYEKGIVIYCKLEGTRYEWNEVAVGKELTGLRATDFTYPAGHIIDGVTYSNKKYNFFKIESGIQINSDWNATSGIANILNKPTIPTLIPQIQSDWNAISGLGVILNKPTASVAQVQTDWNATTGLSSILNKPTIPIYTPQVNSDWNSVSGVSNILNKPIIALPPFNKINNSYFPRGRDEVQFGPIGSFSYDFSDAELGAFADPFGQVGKIGVHPTEQYGALGESTYAFGYNVSAFGYGDTVFGMYNHSDIASQFSLVTGRNNYNNSYSTFMSGSYNTVPYTYLGHKTVFGNGNVVNGSVGLTSGIALLNRSFGTTVIGQANLDYANTEQGVNVEAAPIFIVGNGSVNVPAGIWTALYRSNALELFKNGIMTLPSITVEMIEAASVKAVVTKEFLRSANAIVNLQKIITTNVTLVNADNNYTIIINNGVTPITITVPLGLMNIFQAGFIQQGTADVTFVGTGTTLNSPLGLKLKGQHYNGYLEKVGATEVFQLVGNLKV